MAHDRDYFTRRAAEARAAASTKEHGEGVEVAGQLALAYAALARRRASIEAIDPVIASAVDDAPLLLREERAPRSDETPRKRVLPAIGIDGGQ
jgi:hypothetical protein